METRHDNMSLSNHSSLLSRRIVWTGYAACAWALLFALEHAYWAFGGTWLLASGSTQELQRQFAENPASYIISWAVDVMVFAALALFPLALIWRGKRISQSRMQILTLVYAYVSLFFFVLTGVIRHDSMLIIFSLAVSVLSIPIAFMRPRNQNIPSWLVIFATWIFGIGMILYGLSYFIVAFLNIHAGHFWTYIAAGGLNWTIEGILFIMVAWLANCSGRDAQTRDGEPASIVVQRREGRDNPGESKTNDGL
ncbi:DUF3995 domain-containing protein [Ktedonobacter robiniae]|uniref:DUF3995 domain-containing protein n=1 Tax=Ktedonobacter robiniae TaxID=2778365 RepID=UPI0019160573|nr:DUF3995 domain-containing protein [Ktedonobacter robiniae]